MRLHGQLQKKLRQKISKLEKHLKNFPPDEMHLHIALGRHPKKERFSAALTLRLPSNILRAEKSGPDIIKAFDQVVKAVLRELETFKSKLRSEALWKRGDCRAELHEAKAMRFAAEPQPAGTGPQTLADTVSALLQAEHSRLLSYVRRQLRRDDLAGDIPRCAIDARAVVDEVARQALAAPERKPADASYRLWLYRLARRELSARVRTLRQQSRETVPLEEPRVLAEEAERVAGYEPEQPLNILEETLEPPVVETRELLPVCNSGRGDSRKRNRFISFHCLGRLAGYNAG
jgi:ribosomal subunit interface protein